MGELWRRLWYLLNRARFERELREEMQAHREMKGERGPRFGNTLRLREEAADAWGWGWLDRFSQDVRFGARLLIRTPLFTLTAVLILAVGLGVNLAAYQVFDAVALSWLPVTGPESLVKVERRNPRGASTSFSYPAFDFYRAHGTPFAAAFALLRADVTLDGDDARRVGAQFVSGSYFPDLGAVPLLGRLLTPQDDRPDAPPVIVLAESLWRSRFGADAARVGRPIAVNGRVFEVVGIVPDTFVAFHTGKVLMPIAQHGVAFPGSTLLVDEKDGGAVTFYARLRPGTTIAQAEAALAPVARTLRAERPSAADEGEWLQLLPAGHYLPLHDLEGAAVALVAALFLLVLVAACTNLGLLVLARAVLRGREFSIRLSVGASRGRILRQLLTEYLLLAAIGAAAGCVVAALTVRGFGVLTEMPRGIMPEFGFRSAFVIAGLALLSCVLFGLTPALQAIRVARAPQARARAILVGVQVAAATVLLIVSGLTVRGVTHVVRTPLGFDYRHLLTIDPDLFSHGTTPAAASAYWTALEGRVRQLPGVREVAIVTLPPFGNRVSTNSEQTVFYGVTPSYFATLRIPLRQGRLFGRQEKKVVVISESLARRHWPGGDALGQTYHDATVIGVVGDARTVRVADASTTECYLPVADAELPWSVMVARVDGEPAAAVRALMAAGRSLDPRLSPSVDVVADALDRRMTSARQFTAVASVLALSALLLAVIGMAGIVAFTLSQRIREIGVRVALGARPRHVVAAIARQFAWPVGAGAVTGSLLAAGVGVLLSHELFGISGFDPVAHGAALSLFAAVAAISVTPSIRRALRVDPAATLRHE